MREELFRRTLERVRLIFREEHGGHDLDHTMRVLLNARKIADSELEPCDSAGRSLIDFAALLHDCARPEEDAAEGKLCHAALGREKSILILRELGCSEEPFLNAVSECVGRHRYRGTEKPRTLPEKIVYDADKLDSVGAVGIGRAFHFASRCGARLHNTEETALSNPPYGPEDSAYREFLVKLRDVPGRMLTETGRRLASEREKFMVDFFNELNAETEDVFRFTGELK